MRLKVQHARPGDVILRVIHERQGIQLLPNFSVRVACVEDKATVTVPQVHVPAHIDALAAFHSIVDLAYDAADVVKDLCQDEQTIDDDLMYWRRLASTYKVGPNIKRDPAEIFEGIWDAQLKKAEALHIGSDIPSEWPMMIAFVVGWHEQKKKEVRDGQPKIQ